MRHKLKTVQPNWLKYEQEKAALLRRVMSPEQYQKALREIARRCGV